MTSNCLRIGIAFAGCALYLAATAAPAEAAKGVKKANAGNSQRTYSGVVVSMNPNSSGYGTFHLKSMHHRKMGMVNQNVAANGANAANNSTSHQHVHEFTVNASTQFGQHNGGAANAAMLHVGERVRVRAVSSQAAGNQAAAANQAAGNQVAGHHQAVAVQIMSNNHMRGRYTRHRSNGYYPHYHHHHRR
jgi:hypothetical protein